MRVSRVVAMFVVAGVAAWVTPARSPGQADSTPAPRATRPFIGRILGVFDLASGEPIEGVEVFDLASKSWSLTTATGTVALSFVDSGGSIVRLRKVGYEPLLLTLTNHEGEGPITAVLARSGVALPAVTTTAPRRRAPADTIRKLETTGFYDRRDRSGAAPMAFVLGDRIASLETFDDFAKVTGRPICESNLYLDGVRVKGADIGAGLGALGKRIMPRNVRKNLADQFVLPSNVLAIENYRVGEVPAEYNQTKAADASHDCGATLIWTR